MAKLPDTLVILDQASGYLQIDMLEAYKTKYKNRAIIAATIVERDTPLSKDVKWHKIITYRRNSSFSRIMTWIIASIQMLYFVKFKYQHAHVVAITNPPFSIFIPWVLRTSYDIIIYDMYPDALSNYGYIRNEGLFFKFWSHLNRKVFNSAKRVITLTNGMAKLVNAYMPKNKKAEVIPLWSNKIDFTRIPKSKNVILQQLGIKNKFVLVYSGNLGKTHPIEKLVSLASHLNPEKFVILIIGDGVKKNVVQNLILENNFSHVHLLPWQPPELLAHNLFAGDINVVTLDEIAGQLSIPSKTFNILSIGNPILAICSKKSDLAELISTYDCGIVSNGKDLKKLSQKITELASNKEKLSEFKSNSLTASKFFTKSNAQLYVDRI